MNTKRLTALLGDIFWSALIVVGLLIVGFFILRLVARLGQGSIITRGAQNAASLATPSGRG